MNLSYLNNNENQKYKTTGNRILLIKGKNCINEEGRQLVKLMSINIVFSLICLMGIYQNRNRIEYQEAHIYFTTCSCSNYILPIEI